MITKREDATNSSGNGKYKHVYIKTINGVRYYSNCMMDEDDYSNLSDVWAKMRRAKLRKNPVCEICGSAINVLVHHVRYPAIWGEEKEEDLMTVCDNCHQQIHNNQINAPQTTKYLTQPMEEIIPY